MTRLIDADKLHTLFDEKCAGECESCTYYEDCKDHRYCGLIDNAPTVEERKQGKWIRITKNTAFIQMWNCSECGRTVEKATVLDPDIFFPFCHCGAEMRGTENGD